MAVEVDGQDEHDGMRVTVAELTGGG